MSDQIIGANNISKALGVNKRTFYRMVSGGMPRNPIITEKIIYGYDLEACKTFVEKWAKKRWSTDSLV